MKLSNIIETEQVKPRPSKTLWFDNYDNWVRDIKTQFPDAEAHKHNESEDIIALSPSGDESYGIWRSNRNLGVSYASPRPKYTVVHPRSKLDKVKKIK